MTALVGKLEKKNWRMDSQGKNRHGADLNK